MRIDSENTRPIIKVRNLATTESIDSKGVVPGSNILLSSRSKHFSSCKIICYEIVHDLHIFAFLSQDVLEAVSTNTHC